MQVVSHRQLVGFVLVLEAGDLLGRLLRHLVDQSALSHAGAQRQAHH